MEAHNAHHHHHVDMGGSFGASIMAATDFLMVDDLLDFSNEEIAGPIGDSCNNNETNTNANAESSALTDSTTIADTIHFDAGDYPPQDLCVPLDEVAELEWLSNFVEDSFSTESVSAAAAAAELSNTANNGAHESTATKKTLINSNNDNDYSAETAEENTAELHPVRGRARSKRSRAAVCNWVSYLLSPTSSSATTKLSDSCGSSSGSECSNQPNCGSSALVAASKPKKRTTAASAAAAATTAVEERKCSHCGTHKTPQWRAGPEGPKTLCNACGVRFKSGRLLPEYRPASSPTFVVSLHSNSHRKVLEMRRKKQQQVQSHKHHIQELVQGLIRGSSSSSTVAPTSTHDASTSAHSVFIEKKFDDECLLHTATTSVVEHSFCRV